MKRFALLLLIPPLLVLALFEKGEPQEPGAAPNASPPPPTVAPTAPPPPLSLDPLQVRYLHLAREHLELMTDGELKSAVEELQRQIADKQARKDALEHDALQELKRGLEQLKDITEKYPNTEAARHARVLLKSKPPQPQPRKIP